MINRSLTLTLALALVALMILPAPVSPAAEQDATLPDAAPGMVLVGVPPHLDRVTLTRLAAQQGGRVERWLPDLGLALLRVPAGEEAATVRALGTDSLVDFAGTHRPLATIADTPLDEHWAQQWGMVQVEAPAGWELGWGMPGGAIAIVDTGVQQQQLDLRDQTWYNPGESAVDGAGRRSCDTPLAYNNVDDDENGYVDDCRGYDFSSSDGQDNDPRDQNGHGTAVAGIAAAATNNSDPAVPGAYEGVAGMARQASIMALRALDAEGKGYAFDIAEAIGYAAANGAGVINLSLTFPPQTSGSSPDMQAVERAVVAAQAAGALVVAAAGNESYNGIDYPARFAGVAAVGASNQADQRASFSNYGDRLDLLAPGTGIYTTLMAPGNGSYGLFKGTGNGTSFATPHVAGAAALVRGLRPDLSQAEVRDLLLHTADDLGAEGRDPQTGWGRLNLRGALLEAAQGLSLELGADPPGLAAGAQTALRAQVRGPDGVMAGQGARVTFATTAGTVTPATATADNAGRAEVTFTAPELLGAVVIGATLGSASAYVNVLVSSGIPATVAASAQPAVVPVGGQSTITADVRDDAGNSVRDGIFVDFAATLGSVTPARAATDGGRAETVFTAGQAAGQGLAQATVGSIRGSVPVIVVGPGEPYSMTLSAEPVTGQVDGPPITLTATVWDGAGQLVPDGTAVRFETDLGAVAPLESLTAHGKATAQLQPGAAAGVAHVTTTSGYATGKLAVPVLAGAAASVTLSAQPTELTAGYNQVAALVLTAADSHGNPIPDGSIIQFSTTLGNVTPPAAPTTGGRAEAQFVGGTIAGSALITATAPGGAKAQATVVIQPAAASQMALEALPAEIIIGGDTSRLKATVRDAFGNPVKAGTVVTFTTDLGTLRTVTGAPAQGSTLPVGTAQGVAQADLVSGQEPGTAHVRAEVAGLAAQIVSVAIKPGAASSIRLTLQPSIVQRGGRLDIIAVVTDKNGNPVADGTVVSFAASRGVLDQATAATTDGMAYTWLTAPLTPGPVDVVALTGSVSAFETAAVASSEIYLPVIRR